MLRKCLVIPKLTPSAAWQRNMVTSGKHSFPTEKYCISYDDVLAAHDVIKPYIHRTAAITCATIDKLCGRNVFMKCENMQKTGSFKIRGALNAIFALTRSCESAESPCVVTHSSGNHGQAVAKAAQIAGIPAYIVMPTTAPDCKKDAVKIYGGVVVECPPTEEGRVEVADRVCKETGGHLIHANQTPEVIAGQGTIAVEMLQQNPHLDVIVAAVGGGGMISGIAIAAKQLKPSIKVYAAEPEEANDCLLSKRNGYITPVPKTPNTIADAVKVTIGENSWPIIRDLVDDVLVVSEDEIKAATKLVWERAKLVIEPSAGVAIAAVIGNQFAPAAGNSKDLRNIGVVLCGGNADLQVAAKMFSEMKTV